MIRLFVKIFSVAIVYYKISKTLHKRLLNGAVRNDNEFNVPILLLATRFLKSSKAIIVLCAPGLGEEAMSLFRTTIELFINIKYITKEPELNALRFKRFACVSQLTAHNVIKKHSPHVRNSHFDWMVDEVEYFEMQKELDDKILLLDKAYDKKKQQKCDQRGWWSGKTLSQMSSELGAEIEWLYEVVYWGTSGFTHSNPFWLKKLAKPNGREVVFDYKASRKFVEEAIGALGEYLIKLFSLLNDFFALHEDLRLKQIEKWFYKIHGR